MFKKKGGGVKGLLNNVKKNCTFLKGWLPLLQVESLDVSRLHLDQLLSCRLKVDLTFPTVVVDRLLLLHKPAQVLDVSLQEHLRF